MKNTGEVREISILDLKGGAIVEKVNCEVEKVLRNILDPNTDGKKKRQIKVTIDFIPTEDRESVTVKSTVSSTLAPLNPVDSVLIVGGTEEAPAAMEYKKQIAGQTDLTGSIAEEPAVIALPHRA